MVSARHHQILAPYGPPRSLLTHSSPFAKFVGDSPNRARPSSGPARPSGRGVQEGRGPWARRSRRGWCRWTSLVHHRPRYLATRCADVLQHGVSELGKRGHGLGQVLGTEGNRGEVHAQEDAPAPVDDPHHGEAAVHLVHPGQELLVGLDVGEEVDVDAHVEGIREGPDPARATSDGNLKGAVFILQRAEAAAVAGRGEDLGAELRELRGAPALRGRLRRRFYP